LRYREFIKFSCALSFVNTFIHSNINCYNLGIVIVAILTTWNQTKSRNYYERAYYTFTITVSKICCFGHETKITWY